MTRNELESAVLRVLMPALGHGPTSVLFELGYGDPSEVEEQAKRIAEYRSKVARIVDKETRHTYEKWLDFFQRENEEARREVQTGTKRRAWLRYKRNQEIEQTAIDRVVREIEKP